MTNTTYHLVIFLASLGAIVTLIATGHASPELSSYLPTLLAGGLGGSGASAMGNLLGSSK